jgi:hypothetical protein
VTNDLARATNFVVVSDTAARSAALAGEPPTRAGRELGASHLVLGRVKTVGSRLRVDLEVFVTAANRVASTGVVEAAYASLASNRGALSEAVRNRLTAVGLPVPAIPAQAAASRPVDRLALEYYARGREYLLNADASRNLDLAIDQFDKSLAREPEFALAHAGLAEAMWRRYRDTRDVSSASKAQASAFDALRASSRPRNGPSDRAGTGSTRIRSSRRWSNHDATKSLEGSASFPGLRPRGVWAATGGADGAARGPHRDVFTPADHVRAVPIRTHIHDAQSGQRLRREQQQDLQIC